MNLALPLLSQLSTIGYPSFPPLLAAPSVPTPQISPVTSLNLLTLSKGAWLSEVLTAPQFAGFPFKNVSPATSLQTFNFSQKLENPPKTQQLTPISFLKSRSNESFLRSPRKNRKLKVKKCSKFRGVFWNSNSNCWQARIMVNGVSRHLGFFDDETDAAVAYDLTALEFRGENTYLNFDEKSRRLFKQRADSPKSEIGSCMKLASRRKRKVADRTTPLRGVCWHKGTKKWKAAISIKGKYTHIGYFDDANTAKAAYDRLAKALKDKTSSDK